MKSVDRAVDRAVAVDDLVVDRAVLLLGPWWWTWWTHSSAPLAAAGAAPCPSARAVAVETTETTEGRHHQRHTSDSASDVSDLCICQKANRTSSDVLSSFHDI